MEGTQKPLLQFPMPVLQPLLSRAYSDTMFLVIAGIVKSIFGPCATRTRKSLMPRQADRRMPRHADRPTGLSTRHAIAGLLLIVVATAGCDGVDAPRQLEGFLELQSPPGEGSGEANLALDGQDVILSWLEPLPGHASADVGGEASDEGRGAPMHALRMARWSGGEWDTPWTVAEGSNFFVNWADFPSVVPVTPSRLAAHWLVRGEAGGYDYSIHIATSTDDGENWSEAWTPHDDGTPTEHGFVTLLPLGDERLGVLWLDGRDYARAAADTEAGREAPGPRMALRFRESALEGGDLASGAGEEIVLDPMVCDCCQTAAARTSRGIVAVYRGRTPAEVRDITVVRFEEGSWSEPHPVHEDGWVINACPVNGPAIAASGDGVVVAWFTGAGGTARVRAAFSKDGGSRFTSPLEIDGGNPAGRVGVALLEDGSALVSWLERVEGGAEVRVRRISPDGTVGRSHIVAASSEARASGFPRMLVVGGNRTAFAWTDPGEAGGAGRVRVAFAGLPAF